jgi:hypothetical protein
MVMYAICRLLLNRLSDPNGPSQGAQANDARSDLVIPTSEPVVESERHQVRPGRAEIVPPSRERLGIILPENAFANDGNAEPLAERFQHPRRRQHSVGKNVTLDEIDVA